MTCSLSPPATKLRGGGGCQRNRVLAACMYLYHYLYLCVRPHMLCLPFCLSIFTQAEKEKDAALSAILDRVVGLGWEKGWTPKLSDRQAAAGAIQGHALLTPPGTCCVFCVCVLSAPLPLQLQHPKSAASLPPDLLPCQYPTLFTHCCFPASAGCTSLLRATVWT